jgi:hypothetical protein
LPRKISTRKLLKSINRRIIMPEAVIVENISAGGAKSGVSWAAIFAGALIAWVITIMLIIFGSSLGFAFLSPYRNWNITPTGFHVASGIFTLATAFIASIVGGYITGRLRTRWSGFHSDEVYFRDTAHGFLSWALATVFVGALALGVPAGMALSAVNSGVSGASASLMQSRSTQPGGDIIVSKLFRVTPNASLSSRASSRTSGGAAGMLGASSAPDSSNLTGAVGEANDGSPNSSGSAGAMSTLNANTNTPSTNMSSMNIGAENDARRILSSSVSSSRPLSEEDRTYIAQIVAARTGLSLDQANARVNTVYEEARSAADTARKLASRIGLWLTASMLLGAFTASLAATHGGRMRDHVSSASI